MSIFLFDRNGRLTLNNGVAYGYIAGGATSFISDLMKWYVGQDHMLYFATLLSCGVDIWKIVALLSIRGALVYAAAHVPAELPGVVAGGYLQLNPAEILRDPDLRQLLQILKLQVSDWVAPAAQPRDGFRPVRVPQKFIRIIKAPNMKDLAMHCAHLTYSILGVNGYGLITSGHHSKGPAENIAINTVQLYDMAPTLEAIGVDVADFCRWCFHDALHPLSFEAVARLVNMNHPSFMSKVANTLPKRFPAFPGGTTYVQRGMSVYRQLAGVPKAAPLIAVFRGAPIHRLLLDVFDAISVDPLTFTAQFHQDMLALATPALDALKPYCVSLFGIYDAWIPPARGQAYARDGPTGGPGIRRVIHECLADYQAAREAALTIFATIPNETPVVFATRVAHMPAPGLP